MLTLRALQVFHWGYAPFQVPLPIGKGVTLIQGRNGGGKTTYLNAVALLLGVRVFPRSEPIEKFIYPGETWAFVRGIADNVAEANGRRPFDTILHTFDDSVTLACLLERKEGAWKRNYFIVPGNDFSPAPDQAVDKSYRYTQTDFRRMLAQVGVRDMLLRLLELGLHGLQDGSNDATQRFLYFSRLVGDETILQEYKTSREAWHRQREETARLERQKDEEEVRLSDWAKQIQLARQQRDLQARRLLAEKLASHAQLRELHEQKNRAENEREAAQEKLKATEQEIAAGGVRRARFEQSYEQWQTRYHAWRAEREGAETAARDAERQYQVADMNLQQQQTKVKALMELPATPLAEAQAAGGIAEEALRAARNRVEQLALEQTRLRQEQARLRAGETPMPEEVTQFLEALQWAGLSGLLVADAVEVLERDWQAAVEGALGGERFTVVMDEEAAQVRAKQIGQEKNYRHYVSPPNRRLPNAVVPNSLWNVVRISDERAQGWVAARLASIQRVASIQEGHELARQGVTSITARAYLQEARGGRSAFPRDLVCGRAAREARLQDLETRLATLDEALKAARLEHADAQQRQAGAQRLIQQAEARLTLPEEQTLLDAMKSNCSTKLAASEKLRAVYQACKALEDEYRQQDKTYTAEGTRLTVQERQNENDLIEDNRLVSRASTELDRLARQISILIPTLQALDADAQHRLETEQLTAEQYRQVVTKCEEELGRLPAPQFSDLTEPMYEQQRSVVEQLRSGVEQMRQREREHFALFEKAIRAFEEHIHQLFGTEMNREFARLCAMASAQGDIRVLHDEQDEWSLEVRVGFHGKLRQALENAPLSQGQRVVIGLFLVLAALRAAKATPILLLDELISTLDEKNARIVLSR